MQVIIKNIKDYGTVYAQGIHQVLENEGDIENAAENADRDNFNRIFFYVSYHAGWMGDTDFRSLVAAARDLDTQYYMVDKTYQVVTPESAEEGDFSDNGFEWENRKMTREGIIDLIASEGASLDGGNWFSTEPDLDYSDASETTYHFHISRLNGTSLSENELMTLIGMAPPKNYSKLKVV